jgi:sugar phosphate isomerase/epimerase
MTHAYSLAHLTALSYDPPRLVQLAADTGYDAAGIRLLPAAPGGAAYPLMEDAAMLRETIARIQGTGVPVLDLELIRIGGKFDASNYLSFMDVGARLGAKHILVAGDEPDAGRMTEHFARLCDAAAPYGLSCDLEFMPWTAVADLGAAMRIVESAGRANGGVLVDAIHFARSASTLVQLQRMPRSWLHYAQICDAPVPAPTTVEGLVHDARCARLLPGEGGMDLRGLFARLPADLPVSIEIPHDVRAPAMGYEAWAKMALAHTKRVLEGAA